MAWLSSSQNARSSWPGVMPRSRQISAMTAPTGRRRTSAAISSSVGRRARRGSSGWLAGWSSGWALGGAGCGEARGPRAAGRRMGAGVRFWPLAARRQSAASRAAARRRPLAIRARMAAEIGSAEGSGEQGEVWGGGALLDRAGDLPAVVDQFADEAEDAAEGGGHGSVDQGRIGVRGRGRRLDSRGHEQDKNIEGVSRSRKNFLH